MSHAGPAVVGRMGWGESLYLTAVGYTVHVAARLERATKDYGAELVVSEDRRPGTPRSISRPFPATTWPYATAPGRVAVRVVERVASLPTE